MKIGREQVEHVAKLARLSLSEEEMRSMTYHLDRILEYMDKLNVLDTAGVEPTSHVIPMTNVFREDEPAESLTVEAAISNAPDASDGLVKVPKIIE